jgi:hypothetical protein
MLILAARYWIRLVENVCHVFPTLNMAVQLYGIAINTKVLTVLDR